MKYVVFIMLFCFALPSNGQNNDLIKWLGGSWQNQKNGSIEYWQLNDQGGLTGKVYKLEDGDTTIIEKLEILKNKKDWFYKADVDHNPEPTYFKMTLIEENHFVCEALEHDFPKQIEYAYNGLELIVIISDGGDKKYSFQFKKIE